MNRIRLTLETFIEHPQEDWEDPWSDGTKKTSLILQGGVNVNDIVAYWAIRDDRVAVMMPYNRLISVVSTLEDFEHTLDQAGV